MPLLTYEQYVKIQHTTPYTLVIQCGDSYLYYFGERHSFDPSDEQWKQEKVFWKEFLAKTANHKRIVFTEGGIRPVEEGEEKAILKHGGMGLVTHLANFEGIKTHSPEPDRKLERTALTKLFQKEYVQYYYFSRVVLQWNKTKDPKPVFEDYIANYLKRDEGDSNWGNFEFSLEAMKRIHADIFKSQFNKDDSEFFYDASNPSVIQSEVNKVSRASSILRDEHIVKEIQKYLQNGFSIFAQYGASHVVIQEPLLKEILG